MLITPALAQSGGFSGGGLGGLMPIVLVMVIFYFLLIRPQQKRAKQHKAMLAAVAKGDKIITHGENREVALARMRQALDELVVEGIRTNTPLHRDLVRDAAFADGGVSIHYLESKLED